MPVFAVDSNGVVPLALLGEPAAAAVHFRPRLHRAFVEAWPHRARKKPGFDTLPTGAPDPPFDLTDLASADGALDALPLAAPVPPVEGAAGGTKAARERFHTFLTQRLEGYSEDRSIPRSPGEGHASGLSPYLRHGHISIEEVVEDALGASGDWNLDALRYESRGKREGFWGCDPDTESFLDEALTWRDIGYHWHRTRHAHAKDLATALPRWALETLRGHASDPRPYLYSFDEWERAETHDPLWNAAQRELVATGTMHNYMRMLWGKKVLEWSRSPEEAYATLVCLNNRYALDGCDPNSWTGILWCFGLFDRPWAPGRAVLGTVRYMSSANTARKFRLAPYLAYVETLPLPSLVLSSVGRKPLGPEDRVAQSFHRTLKRQHPREEPTGSFELGRCPGLHNSSLIQDHDPVEAPEDHHPVGDQKKAKHLTPIQESAEDLAFGEYVEMGRGLVEDQKLCARNQGPGEDHTLAFSAGKPHPLLSHRRIQPLGPLLHGRSETGHLERGVERRLGCRLPRQNNVGAKASSEDVGVLCREEGDAGQGLRVESDDVPPADPDDSRRRLKESRGDPSQRRFAGSARTHQRHPFPSGDAQAHVLEERLRLVGEAKRQVADVEGSTLLLRRDERGEPAVARLD